MTDLQMLGYTTDWLSYLWNCADYDVLGSWGLPVTRTGRDDYDVLRDPSLLLSFPSVCAYAWADLICHSTTRVFIPPDQREVEYVPSPLQAAGR